MIGSVNYFPLTDGSAIVTKQLQADGTSKIVIYKPTTNETPKYVTSDDLNNEMNNLKQELEKIRNKTLNRVMSMSKPQLYQFATNYCKEHGIDLAKSLEEIKKMMG